jgi:hypothetical protein
VLLAQLATPFAALHALPQKPQLASELVRLVSQSPALVSQSPRPCGHIDTWQLPPMQA